MHNRMTPDMYAEKVDADNMHTFWDPDIAKWVDRFGGIYKISMLHAKKAKTGDKTSLCFLFLEHNIFSDFRSDSVEYACKVIVSDVFLLVIHEASASAIFRFLRDPGRSSRQLRT